MSCKNAILNILESAWNVLSVQICYIILTAVPRYEKSIHSKVWCMILPLWDWLGISVSADLHFKDEESGAKIQQGSKSRIIYMSLSMEKVRAVRLLKKETTPDEDR